MMRAHRAVHRWLWPVLALAVTLGFTLALAWRPPPDPPQERPLDPPTGAETAK